MSTVNYFLLIIVFFLTGCSAPPNYYTEAEECRDQGMEAVAQWDRAVGVTKVTCVEKNEVVE